MGLSLVGRHPIRSGSGYSHGAGLNASFRFGARALHDSPLSSLCLPTDELLNKHDHSGTVKRKTPRAHMSHRQTKKSDWLQSTLRLVGRAKSYSLSITLYVSSNQC